MIFLFVAQRPALLACSRIDKLQIAIDKYKPVLPALAFAERFSKGKKSVQNYLKNAKLKKFFINHELLQNRTSALHPEGVLVARKGEIFQWGFIFDANSNGFRLLGEFERSSLKKEVNYLQSHYLFS